MASVYSEGPERAQGGYWGWQERKGIVKELSDAAFALKPGQHTGVLELNNTCFLLQVIAFKPKHTKTLPEVRERIERDLVAKEQARLSKQWIDRLKTKSFVRYF
jgi:parvulin-like peptidyl-prolyl isomerase